MREYACGLQVHRATYVGAPRQHLATLGDAGPTPVLYTYIDPATGQVCAEVCCDE